jgi:acetyltransferase, GNAT family
MNIRKAVVSDFNRIMEIYAIARKYMKNSGNPNQWKDHYPEKNIVNKDIEDKISYVLEDNGHIFACFVFTKGYEKSYELNFPSDKEYGIIHRVASDGSERKIVSRIINFVKK